MKRLVLVLVCLTFAGALHAQTTTDAAKADGKAFGRDKAAAAQGAATTNPDASRIPGFGGVPVEASFFADPDRMSREAASQTSTSTGYRTMRDSMDRRARFAPKDLDATIARSKVIGDNPLSYTSGMGIGYSPTWLFEPELANGEVMRLMPDWESPQSPIHLVSPPERKHSAKVKAFVEHVGSALTSHRQNRLEVLC